MTKIISWNVNGIRAIHKKGFLLTFINRYKPDILCLQETKASEEQLSKELTEIKGYTSYFSSCQTKKGYSGVAIYTKQKPNKVTNGFGKKEFDKEGRTIVAEYDNFILFNVYFPNGGQGPHRIEYKMNFYEAFLKHINHLKEEGQKVVFCGDINTAHTEIDLARPKENEKNTGFLPIERAWMDKLIKYEWVDVFRYFYPTKKEAYTYWDQKSRARERNVGWRIDYFFVSPNMIKEVRGIRILDKVLGSDHAPIEITI